MKKLFILSVLAIGIIFSGFSQKYTPLTNSMQEKYGIKKADLSQIQFYVSEEILMNRELSGNVNNIIKGKLKTVNNKRVDEVKIKSKTPCLVVDTNSKGNLKVSFSESNDRTLTFGITPHSSKYVLLAEKWDGSIGTVNYGGEKYQVRGFGYEASLLVKTKDLLKVKKNRQKEKGRKL